MQAIRALAGCQSLLRLPRRPRALRVPGRRQPRRPQLPARRLCRGGYAPPRQAARRGGSVPVRSWVLQLCTGPVPALIPRAHPANFVCLPGLTFLRIRRRMGEEIEPASTPGRPEGAAAVVASRLGVLGAGAGTGIRHGRSWRARSNRARARKILQYARPGRRQGSRSALAELSTAGFTRRPAAWIVHLAGPEARNATLPADYERLARVLEVRAGARCHPVLGNRSHQSPRDSGNVLRAELPLNSLAAQCAAPWRITRREGGPDALIVTGDNGALLLYASAGPRGVDDPRRRIL